MQHHIVYREKCRYAGWPANYGIWSWGNEIVVGFVVGSPKPDSQFHARDRSKPFVTMQGRSLNGGRTWDVKPMPVQSPGGRALSADEHVIETFKLSTAIHQKTGSIPQACQEAVDFPDIPGADALDDVLEHPGNVSEAMH